MTRKQILRLSKVGFFVAVATCAMQLQAAGKTYTLNADFDQGTSLNVNHLSPDQLQLNVVTSTFPFLWVANGGEDTVSKIDTKNNKEVARYRTWFGPSGQPGYYNHLGDPWSGPAPSRTAVDKDGNAYVLNRHFEGRPAVLLKILASGGIDRNGNGVIDTSLDANDNGTIDTAEIIPLADSNSNGVLDPNELADERIAWAVRVGPAGGLGRGLCIGTDGNLWVGLFNSQAYYKVRATDGAILAGPISTTPTPGMPSAGAWTPYGCLIDGQGTLWSAGLNSPMGKITNTQSNTGPWTISSFYPGYSNYGIALGSELGVTMVYLATPYNNLTFAKFNSATNTFTNPTPPSSRYSTSGIVVDGAGDVVTGPYGSGGLVKYKPDGTVVWTAPTQFSGETRGVIPDQDNNLWQISRTGARVMKYRGTDGAPLGMVSVGNQPYTYSDASGSTVIGQTSPSGSWTVTFDSGTAGSPWAPVWWNDSVPAGASLSVRVRTADTPADLPLKAWTNVTKGGPIALTGRYIEAQANFATTTGSPSPVLYDLTLATPNVGKCDADQDGDIDQADLALISKARGQTPTANDPRDANGDGRIDPLDVKTCIPRCTRANCAIQ
ncbi:hypothetical protein [Zoogloea sp.]|uniref:hypothetical protein n=1 Tax=Zoogloea sp. TaxID=49181 RepID=UPI0035B3C314